MSKCELTVLMSVYNGEQFLAEAIESILRQTFRDFEFLIINDGSTDTSESIIKSYNDSRNENSPQQAAGYLTLSPIGP